MRQSFRVIMGAAWIGVLGCGSDGTTAPGGGSGNGAALGRQFETLADSVASAGDSVGSSALRHAAEIVRLTGHATPVSLVIDGAPRSFLGVAEQMDFPNLMCSWPGDSGVAPPGDTTIVVPPGDSSTVMPPDTMLTMSSTNPDSGMGGSTGGSSGGSGECTVVGTTSMRTLIAWEPEHMAEVVRIVADVGTTGVDTTVPDIMVSLPTMSTRPDTADSTGGGGGMGGGGFGGTPGFMGEYMVATEGSWFAVEGSQTNALEELAGSCTTDRATIDWAEFDCVAARIRFGFDMHMEPLRYIGVPLGVPNVAVVRDSSHIISMAPTSVDGVRLTVVAWTPPPLPPPEPGPGPDPIPLPPDSVMTQ